MGCQDVCGDWPAPVGPPGGGRRGGEGDALELYFGATSGDVFGSGDGGATWFTARQYLAPVTSVRVA